MNDHIEKLEAITAKKIEDHAWSGLMRLTRLCDEVMQILVGARPSDRAEWVGIHAMLTAGAAEAATHLQAGRIGAATEVIGSTASSTARRIDEIRRARQ